MQSPEFEQPKTVSARAEGDDAIEFTFPDGQTFVREQVAHIVGWASVTGEDGRTTIDLHCRDACCLWITSIVQDAKGRCYEMILLPRMPIDAPQIPARRRLKHLTLPPPAPHRGQTLLHPEGAHQQLAVVHS